MWWNPKTLEESLAPISWLNCLFGLGVFEIPTGQRRPILTLIYNVIIGVGFTVLLIKGLPQMFNDFHSVVNIVYTFIKWVNISVAFASVVNGWFKLNTLREVKEKFAALDNSFFRLGMKTNYVKESRIILFYLFLWIVMTTTLSVANYYWTAIEGQTKDTLYFTFLIMIPNSLNFVVDFTFTVFVRGLYIRVAKLNEHITDTVENLIAIKYNCLQSEQMHGIRKITVLTNSGSTNNFVKQYTGALKQVHLEIVRLARLLNRAYCLVLLLELGVSFTIITGSMYQLYLALLLLDPHNSKTVYKVACITTWVLSLSLKVVILNYECNAISREVNVTAQILREFNRVHENDELRDQIQQFSMQLILHPINFTAAGFVRLNNDFTRVFFGAVATYMVILIQVSDSPLLHKM